MGASSDGDLVGHALSRLTEPQRRAVVAEDPRLCVLAGAGSGKTRVLTLRVVRRVADGSADEDRVLVCTFSRKAADELKHRLWTAGIGRRPGPDGADNGWRRGAGVRGGTFHRTALHLLCQRRADLGAEPPRILSDRARVIGTLLEQAGGSPMPSQRGDRPARSVTRGPDRSRAAVGVLESEINWAKARLVPPGDYEAAARAAGRRTRIASAQIADLYQRYEEEKWRRRVLDLDDLLWTCADALEEDQRFAAAVRWQFRHLFVDEMQDVNPAQFRLLRALMGVDGDLFVVGDPNQSVYGWNGADPTLLEHLPDVLPGMTILRLEENHRSSPQVVEFAGAVLGRSAGNSGRGQTSSRADGPVPRLSELTSEAEEAAWVAREVWRARRPGRGWSAIAVLARTNAQLQLLAEAFGQARIPHRMAGTEVGPASDLHRLRTAASDDHDPGDEADDPGDPAQPVTTEPASSRPDDDAVVLSTFHRAKGLQWPTVFVVGLSEGVVPIASARSGSPLDEERRLLYVALTRAEDELHCSWSGRPSRWVADLTRARDELVARRAPADHASASAHLARLRQLAAVASEPATPPARAIRTTDQPEDPGDRRR